MVNPLSNNVWNVFKPPHPISLFYPKGRGQLKPLKVFFVGSIAGSGRHIKIKSGLPLVAKTRNIR